MTTEMMAQHVAYLVFFFALGASVGSFLNVVVWRLPRGESLVTPPSRCPKCGTRLAWYDNVPVFGWIWLKGKCRYCSLPISRKYPIVEAVTGLLFVAYYYLFFIAQRGPCAERPLMIGDDWPIFGLYLFALACLLASSLVDAELFIIPPQIPWLLAAVGVVVHTVVDRPTLPGALNVSPAVAALSLGAIVGLVFANILLWKKVIPISFPEGEPLLDVDRDVVAKEIEEARRKGEDPPPLPPPYTPGQIRMEMGKEILFLMPASVLGTVWLVMTMYVPGVHAWWDGVCSYHWVTGLLGACMGAMVGGLVVWLTRILGTLGFGRVAMGLGDVHLMFGVGAVIGAGASTVAFFIAPFFGLLIALYFMITRTRRELPYGPYLSLGTAFVMAMYCPIAAYFRPGFENLMAILSGQ